MESQPWTLLFLLPGLILLALVGIGWVIKKLWKASNENNIDGIGF